MTTAPSRPSRAPRTPRSQAAAEPAAERSPGQNELAYARLKEALVTLQYPPGEYLNTSAVMERLGLGRTPINHALHRLEAEGLVQIAPRKGVVVSPLSIDEALALAEVRMVNETLCARLAAASITAAEVRKLRATASRLETAIARRDMAAIIGLDSEFHQHIATASRNVILAELLGVLHARSQRFWALSLSSESHLREVLEEHQQIIAALEKGDGELAAAAISAHILSFRDSLMRGRGG